MSQRLYALLLRLLPRPFRDAHGLEMEQAFRSSLREARERWGPGGFVGTWLAGALDVLTTSHYARADLRDARRRGREWSAQPPAHPPARPRLEIPAMGDLFADLSRDVRLAVRGLARTPGFSAAVVLTLGVGIGANTAIFQVINETILRPLPYPDSDQLVFITTEAPALGIVGGKVSAREARDWQASIGSLEGVAVLDQGLFSLGGGRVAGPRGYSRCSVFVQFVRGARRRAGSRARFRAGRRPTRCGRRRSHESSAVGPAVWLGSRAGG